MSNRIHPNAFKAELADALAKAQAALGDVDLASQKLVTRLEEDIPEDVHIEPAPRPMAHERAAQPPITPVAPPTPPKPPVTPPLQPSQPPVQPTPPLSASRP